MNAPAAARPVSRPVRERPTRSDPSARRVFDASLIAVFLGLTFLLGVFPLKDTDFWWHLKAGDLIRQTGWVPTTDTLTFGAAGHRWVDLHWVFQLLISFGFEQVGVVGLNIGKCLVTCLAVSLLITSGRREWPIWVTLLAWVPAILVLSGRMYLRPETLTLLYLAADIAILARWDRRPWLAWGLPLIQICWVNTQGLFVFGPFLIGVALVDAATRRGVGPSDPQGWWRTVLPASGAAVLACLVNPYGLRGAIYPVELLGTMGNPIFKNIGELKPVATLFAEVGFDSLPLTLHFILMLLGALSFLIPTCWRVVTHFQDRRTARASSTGPTPRPKGKGKARRTDRQPDAGLLIDDRPLRGFRLVIFLTFSALSMSATRNSHQFGAMVGTVMAWNWAEWAAEIATRRHRKAAQERVVTPVRAWPRMVTLAVLVATIVAVGSGRFYAWSGEGRTIGIGEEPLWFPHAATKFAGSPGMPDRLIGFHNGHPALFEYYWGPAKQVYTDARLEVMGPDVYRQYLDLQRRIGRNDPTWTDDLDRLGRPSVLVDNLDPTNSNLTTTLLLSQHWRCVWFDPIVSIFVHDSLTKIVRDHEVDFLARHYYHVAEAEHDPATLRTMTKSLRGVGTQVRLAPGGEQLGRNLIRLALDYADQIRTIDPSGFNGIKQTGLLHFLRDPLPGTEPIPRFRLAFDPTIDLALVESAYWLGRALTIDPDDGACLYYLATLDQMRGMDEAALPLLERYADQPNLNLEQQREKRRTMDQAAAIRHQLGPAPDLKWANMSELEQLVDQLLRSGRAATAATVIAGAHRAEGRPWAWADRLATLRLHLGEPDLARVAWRDAPDPPSPALRLARIATTYLVETDLATARTTFQEAIAADPNLFEAHFGLARVEQAAGHATAAVEAARRAEATAANDHSRFLARGIVNQATPYQH